MMMTSWAIVCDVWYLPAMHRREDESAIDFANRVKSVIAKQVKFGWMEYKVNWYLGVTPRGLPPEIRLDAIVALIQRHLRFKNYLNLTHN